METIAKLKDVAEHMDLEPAEEQPALTAPQQMRIAPCGQVLSKQQKPAKKVDLPIYNAKVSGGKTVPLLKTMLTTACERNCFYCPFRAGRNYRRQTFQPEELAKAFMDIHRAGAVDGLFLSSGIIKGGVTTQDRLLDTADILRNKFHFRGYLHLKLMPGAEKDQVLRGMQLADRLSVNLEAPNVKRLAMLAPKKQFAEELLRPLRFANDIRQSLPAHQGWNGRWASTTTQFVVGAVDETDLELLFISELLIKKYKLSRIYYSAFNPIKDTPLENLPPENPMRQHRLYQTSYLFRDYGYDLEEMPFDADGNLPLDEDPKVGWAKENLLHEPVELNRAEPQTLLRVPGIGPKGANRIVWARRRGTLRELRDLQKIGVQTKRMVPYVLLDGKRPFRQLSLFD
ncbi:MAG: helix-hairpin-helix domain-containing protein [Anaerolineales bacterium]|nr:helix-hairpin-helix domain-containing protein [Anaerolineales bacterium]